MAVVARRDAARGQAAAACDQPRFRGESEEPSKSSAFAVDLGSLKVVASFQLPEQAPQVPITAWEGRLVRLRAQTGEGLYGPTPEAGACRST